MKKEKTVSEKIVIREKAKDTKRRNEGIVCKIDDNIVIMADQYQFTLSITGRSTSYYPCFYMVLDELFDYKSKELMIASDEKTLLSVKKSLDEAKKWMKDLVEPLFSYTK